MHKTNKILTNQNDRYFDREISWLSFNQRVLRQAYDETILFVERLRFICISSENLDEFYMVELHTNYFP
jgi:polyphosphate kinase